MDMLTPQNIFLNIQDFNNHNNTNITILEYNALKCCIPKAWRKVFLHNDNIHCTLPIEPCVQIGTIKKSVAIVKTKELYKNLIMEKMKPPNSS